MVSDGFRVCGSSNVLLILWLRVATYDDHPVLKLVAQEHEKDSKVSSSLPHRCACCAQVLCATLHSVVSVQTVPHLSPLSSACSCASCRSSPHCVSWLSRDCLGISTGSHIFDSAWRLSSQRRFSDCTAVPADLHAQALVITPVEHMQHVQFRLGHRSQVFQLVGQIASNHTRCTVEPKPETTCNSLSLPNLDDLLCSSLTPEPRLAARFPSSPWYELCCWTTDPCSQ